MPQDYLSNKKNSCQSNNPSLFYCNLKFYTSKKNTLYYSFIRFPVLVRKIMSNIGGGRDQDRGRKYIPGNRKRELKRKKEKSIKSQLGAL